MKLWEKGISTDKKVEKFTIGRDNELDLQLAKFDVLGTMAHITMLETVGLLGSDELPVLLNELANIYHSAEKGEFIIEDGVEDVHSQVELMLTAKLGDMGKKVHSGRSRNDQVLVDLRLYIRDQLGEIAQQVASLSHFFLKLSEQYKDILIPGYTHLQVAMPSSFGLWFGAYAESLADDLILLQSAYRISNQNPLGSAAGYGSSFPLNRTLTTQLLGFSDLSYNVVYAQMGRGKTEKIAAFALGSVGATLSRMAMDACLFMNQNFGNRAEASVRPLYCSAAGRGQGLPLLLHKRGARGRASQGRGRASHLPIRRQVRSPATGRHCTESGRGQAVRRAPAYSRGRCRHS